MREGFAFDFQTIHAFWGFSRREEKKGLMMSVSFPQSSLLPILTGMPVAGTRRVIVYPIIMITFFRFRGEANEL